MTEISLTGIRADLPIGFMASCGCLRICERSPQLNGARLKWVPSGGTYTPVLMIRGSKTDLLDALLADVKDAPSRSYLTWSPQVKSAKKADFIAAMKQARDSRDVEALEWYAAYGSELCTSDNGTLEPTPFDMSVARQRFLADAIRLATSLSGPKSEMIRYYEEALFGPWRYQDDQHSLGWDPSTMKLGAFTYKAPTAMANSGVRAAVWLAFESLPLFPCFFDGRLRTRAIRTNGRAVSFHWPIWDSPLSLTTVSTLLSWLLRLEDLSGVKERRELENRGVLTVYKSAQFKPNKYLTSFRLPELVYAGARSTEIKP